MKDYSRIIGKVTSTPWMITPDALRFMLELFDAHLEGRIKQEDIEARMALIDKREGGRSSRAGKLGILSLAGPIFPKANLMTEMSGATSVQQFRNEFRGMMSDDAVSAVLIDIDSPGGMSDQIEEMAMEIRESREHKPVYAIANTAMNSAAYFIGSQATKLYSTPSGQLGSIGTYTVHMDDSDLQEKKGVKRTIIKAGRFKALSEEPLTAEGRAYLDDYVNEVNDGFIRNVALGRNTTEEDVRQNFGEGGIVTPRHALEAGMIDGIKTIDEVVGIVNAETGGSLAVAAFAGAIQSGTVKLNYSDGTLTYGDNTTLNLVDMTTTNNANTKQSYDADKEHSEPGTGQGGEPVPREAPETGDKAIKGGWRRDPPPPAYETEEHAVNRVWLEERATALGLEFNDETSDEDLSGLVAGRMDEIIVPLNTATAQAQKDQEFAERYPDHAARLARLEQRDREAEAHMFAESYAKFEDSNAGFAPVVREQIEEAHLKLSERRFTHADLKTLLDDASKKESIVPLGEGGSARIVEDKTKVRAGATTQEVRSQFYELVKNAMTEDSLSQAEAIERVSIQNPELAAAYKNS